MFQAGDEVLLDITFTPLPTHCLLSARWQGPFKVTRPAAAPNTYQLELPLTWRAHNEFNVDQLRRYVRAPDWMVADRLPRPSSEVSQMLQFRNRSCRPSAGWGRTLRRTRGSQWLTCFTLRRTCVTSSWLRGPGSHVQTLQLPTPLQSPRLPRCHHRGRPSWRAAAAASVHQL